MTNGISSIDSIKFNFRCHTLAYCKQNYGSEYQIQWASIHVKRSWHQNILEPPSPASMLIARKLWGFLEKRRSLCIIRDFKIHYGGLLQRLLRPWGTKLATPFPPQTSNRLRFRCTTTGCSVSTCLNKNGYVRLYPTFIGQRLDNDFLLLCRSYISQNLDLPLSGF